MFVLSLLTATSLAAGAAPAIAANPVPATATTGSAKDLGLTTATLTATVNANGSTTTYHFEYGTSSSYGLTSAEKPAGSDTTDAAVEAAVTGLTSDTTYHYRVVASNDAGVTRGSDKSLKTTAPARAPALSTGGTRSTQPTSTTLTGSLDPRGASTTFHFEYGPSTKLGSVTADQSASGSGSRTVTAGLTGLSAYTKYYYRLVATNPTGTTRGSTRNVTTLRGPSGLTAAAASATPALWSGNVTLKGKITGSGVGGAQLAVERQDFPFTGATWTAKTLNAAKDGSYSVTIGPLWSATRLRVVSRTTIKVASPTIEIANRVLVGIRRTGTSRTAVGLTGIVNPAAPQGVASVQRLSRTGRWVFVRRTSLTPASGNRSRYSFDVRRTRRTQQLRVVVLPADAGAHVRGVSRELRIRGRR